MGIFVQFTPGDDGFGVINTVIRSSKAPDHDNQIEILDADGKPTDDLFNQANFKVDLATGKLVAAEPPKGE